MLDWVGRGGVAAGWVIDWRLLWHSSVAIMCDPAEFDLPLEAQWEFACRAGEGAALYDGNELDNGTWSFNMAKLGRYCGNGGFIDDQGQQSIWGKAPAQNCTAEWATAKVGSYQPNAWGIYDMIGGLWEMCLDWYADDPTANDPEIGPGPADYSVVRGGCWTMQAQHCRSARRDGLTYGWDGYNEVGFRVCCPASF